MKRIIIILMLIVFVSLLMAEDKKVQKETPKQDTTVVWQKTADIKAGLKYQMDQMEMEPLFQRYKALQVQYNTFNQILNDSLKFRKQ